MLEKKKQEKANCEFDVFKAASSYGSSVSIFIIKVK